MRFTVSPFSTKFTFSRTDSAKSKRCAVRENESVFEDEKAQNFDITVTNWIVFDNLSEVVSINFLFIWKSKNMKHIVNIDYIYTNEDKTNHLNHF